MFSRFPKDESDKIKWNNFLIKNFLNPENVTISSLVCSLHFDKSCFILNKSRKLLKRHATPSIIVDRIKWVCIYLTFLVNILILLFISINIFYYINDLYVSIIIIIFSRKKYILKYWHLCLSLPVLFIHQILYNLIEL